MNKLHQSLRGKEKKEFSLSDLKPKLESLVFYFLILLLPTQLSKHFWPSFSQVLGLRVDYLSPTIYLTDILIFILLVFWISKARPFIIHKTKKTKIPLLLLITLPYLLLTILLSAHHLLGLYQLTKTMELILLAFYTAQRVKTKNELSKIITIFSISLIGESLLAIAQYIHQGSLNGALYLLGERKFTSLTPGIANASINSQLILRPYATFPHPNALAGYLLCMIILIFPGFSNRSNLKKIISTLAILLGQIALLLTLSRSAIIIWIILLSSILIVKIKNSTKKKLPLILTTLLITTLALSSLIYTPALTRLEQTTLTEQSFTQRIDLTKNALSLIATHPLLGVGLGNYLPSVAIIQKPLTSVLYIQPVHNIFLLITAEIGLIGLTLTLCFLFKTYRRLLSSPSDTNKTLIIILSAILILGLFDHYWLTLQQNQLLLALILGLCWAKISTPTFLQKK